MRGIKKENQNVHACVIFGTLKGVLTIEMSFLASIILMIFVLVMYTIFYYHDKNILIGAANETAVVGAQLERKPGADGQTDLAEFYQERIRGKLILFAEAQADVSVSSTKVEVNVSASKGNMRLRITQRAAITEPEKKIRKKRILENLTGEED